MRTRSAAQKPSAGWSSLVLNASEMADRPRPEIVTLILVALSETDGRSLKEIHVSIGIGARSSVASCLRVLCADGRARHEGPDGSRVYFRARCADLDWLNAKILNEIDPTPDLPEETPLDLVQLPSAFGTFLKRPE